MSSALPRSAAALLALVVALAACGSQTPSNRSPQPASEQAEASASASADAQPPPGSASVVYAPNPSAIVVAIDPGHGGCLDWGVADPSARGVELAEKTLALQIALRLRERLRADGITVVMTREEDEALAGDDHPELGCQGPPWRDVNGDGHVGFGSDVPRGTRARDELQARLDLANLARADALVSIHINAPSEGGETIEIAFTQTYYTDERPWGAANAALAEAVQTGVSARLAGVATYERSDRGITAHNLYLVAPPLVTPTEERPNPLAQPTRGALMPAALVEVGSITLRAEHDLLADDRGQDAVADGLFDGLARFFADRPLAARISLADDDRLPSAVDGLGPPFWPSVVDGADVRVRVTNTGTEAWSENAQLVGGWEESEEPYLRDAPELAVVGEVPPLAPGESVVSIARLPAPPLARGVAWISLRVGQSNISDAGSPALQVSTEAP